MGLVLLMLVFQHFGTHCGQ